MSWESFLMPLNPLKSLSGIETSPGFLALAQIALSLNPLKSLSGIETECHSER